MKLLLHVSKLYSIPIIQPLLDYIDTINNIDYVIYTSSKVERKLTKKNIWQDKKIITSLQEGVQFNPHFCLSPANHIDFRLPGIKVQLFHGIGIEKESHFKIRHFFDVYLTSGPIVTKRFQELRQKHKYFLVKETGWLKVDHILSYPRNNLRKQFGLPENKKIILYAPTFSNKMESASSLLKKIPGLIDNDELWLIKFHELMDDSLLNSLSQIENDKVKLVDDYDITPYLHIADVMISDTSSVVYEFMLLDKPVITYRTLTRKDKGININHSDELREALDRTLNNLHENSQTRRKHIAQINPYLDCETPQRIVRSLERIINDNELPKANKPINLGRKAKVLYRQTFGKGV